MRIGFAFLSVILLVQNAIGQHDVRGELASALVGKAMLLQSTCRNSRLLLNAQGVVDDCVQGAWSVHSLFYIQNVKLSGKSLEISGVREVDTVFASGSVHDSKSGDRLTFPDLDRLVLTFQLSNSLTDMASANALLAKAFASPSEREEELALYQKPIPAQLGSSREVGLVGMLGPDRPVYRVASQSGVQPPIAIHPEEPNYSDAARDARIRGSVWLKVVINKHGEPERIQVTRRLGFGLEEKAVIAIAGWKFRPGQKDGHPVAVEISTEMEFHL